MNELDVDIDAYVPQTMFYSTQTTYYKVLETSQVKLINSIVRRVKTRSSIKEMITTEMSYAADNKDSVGLYDYEWDFVVKSLTEKVEAKGTRNKDEINHLIKILKIFIKKEIK